VLHDAGSEGREGRGRGGGREEPLGGMKNQQRLDRGRRRMQGGASRRYEKSTAAR